VVNEQLRARRTLRPASWCPPSWSRMSRLSRSCLRTYLEALRARARRFGGSAPPRSRALRRASPLQLPRSDGWASSRDRDHGRLENDHLHGWNSNGADVITGATLCGVGARLDLVASAALRASASLLLGPQALFPSPTARWRAAGPEPRCPRRPLRVAGGGGAWCAPILRSAPPARV